MKPYYISHYIIITLFLISSVIYRAQQVVLELKAKVSSQFIRVFDQAYTIHIL